jgi:hypothetical protein
VDQLTIRLQEVSIQVLSNHFSERQIKLLFDEGVIIPIKNYPGDGVLNKNTIVT